MTSNAENFSLCKNRLSGLALAPSKTLHPSVFDVRLIIGPALLKFPAAEAIVSLSRNRRV